MSILVTSYMQPDLDGYGGSYAYAELLRAQGHDAVAAVSGIPNDEVTFVLTAFDIPPLAPRDDLHTFTEIVLIDVSEPDLIDPCLDVARVTEILDHRSVHRADLFPSASVQIELIGAAATLVAERLRAANHVPTRASAALLIGGIVSNTVNFRAQSTTDRDRAAYAWLAPLAGLPDDFARQLYRAKSDLSGPTLAKRLEDDDVRYEMGGASFVICQLELVDADALVATRKADILAAFAHIAATENAEHVFVTLADVDAGRCVFVAGDAWCEMVLSSALGVTFVDGVARTETLIMRKQISAALKQTLDGVT